MLNQKLGGIEPHSFLGRFRLRRMPLNQIAKDIAASENIAILPHVSADGDALGSSFALALALSGMGKKAAVFLEEDIPYVYSFLPGNNNAEVYTKMTRYYDTVVAMDCGDIDRLGGRKEVFDSAKMTVNIDHHPTNTAFAIHNYLDTCSSATGEIIYQLLQILGQKPRKDIAICLYVAIATDTGCFRYSNTTPLTHTITAELLKSGVDVADVSQKVFETTSYEKVKLTAEAIHSLELYENGKIAVMALPNELIKKSGAKEEDCDGIINTARNIRGVEVAAMLRQGDHGDIKVNLRSNYLVDVSAIASKYSGGGHKKAAGYTINGVLEQEKNKLLEDIREVL